jgi:hypothetical protein
MGLCVEKSQYKLCIEILRRFHHEGLLKDFILIGSWAVVFYENYFKDSKVLSGFVLRTRDMDFLIENPATMKNKVSVPDLLKDLGFIKSFVGSKGYMKLSHPELILEFLVPEKGRGVDGPVPLPSISMNATALRYLNFLTDNTISVKVEDFFITVPHPANFALHKLIISQRRTKEEKAVKDKDAAVYILKALIANEESDVIQKSFKSVPVSWQKKILNGLKLGDDQELLRIVRNDRK